MPIVAAPFEVISTSVLYDTLSIPLGFASADRAHLFTMPYGAMAYHEPLTGEPRIKNITETNLVLAGQIPAPDKFLVQALRAALFTRRGELLPIVSRYYRGAILDFRISEKSYFRGPLWKVADPAALFASAAGLSEFAKDERLELVRSLRHTFGDNGDPLLIESYQPFVVNLIVDPSFEWEKLTSPGSLVVLLEGVLSRPVM